MNALRELYRANPVLATAGWLHWILLAALIAIYPFDSRTILGLNPWIKPMKFTLSLAIYLWTLGWLLRSLPGRERAVRFISWGVAASAVAEIFCITLQAARGTMSHYNATTAFNSAVFTLMGIMIAFNTVLVAWSLVLFCREQPAISRAYLWGIRWGLVLFLVASAEGGLMIAHGSHTVGARDGGAGLPFVNWSTEHGDLRPAHFLGMHALQILPLIGFRLGRMRWSERAQVSGVIAIAFLYLAAIAALFWMAWQTRPLIAI